MNDFKTEGRIIHYTEKASSSIGAGGRYVAGKMQSGGVNYQVNFYRWVINDVPAFREEPDMNTASNYTSAIEFELSSYKPPYGVIQNFTNTWEEINKDLMEDEDFGLQLNRTGFLKDEVQSVNYGSPFDKMKAAFAVVRNHMKWDGRNRLYSDGIRSAWDKQSGSCADINLALVVLLRQLGLEATPVILSTRSNGMINPSQIMLGQFNYVIAMATIDGKNYMLDATEKACPWFMLPPRCINGQGRIIASGKTDWVDLNTSQKWEEAELLDLALATDGTMSGNISYTYSNYAALMQRSKIKVEARQEDFISKLENENPGLIIKNSEIQDLDSIDKPLREKYTVEIQNRCLQAGPMLTFIPMLFEQILKNPFQIEERKYPVDFIYPQKTKYMLIIQIPDGYTVDEKPADMNVSLPDGVARFRFMSMVNGNRLQIVVETYINKSLFSGVEYKDLREFYKTMVTKQAESVVLKKN